MIGNIDCGSTHEELCNIYNGLLHEWNHVSLSTVIKTVQRLNAKWMVEKLAKNWKTVEDRIIIDGNLTGDKFLDLLNNQIIPGQWWVTTTFVVSTRRNGKPPHYDRRFKIIFLEMNFPNWWIGGRGLTEKLARSPDLKR